MRNTNLVVLIGRLAKDIELRQTPAGKHVAQFSLAVGRDKDTTDWINCVAWEKTAELLNSYAHKGSKIEVTGTIRTRTYDDTNGRKVYVTEVLVNTIELLDSREEAGSLAEEAYTIDVTPDELPF